MEGAVPPRLLRLSSRVQLRLDVKALPGRDAGEGSASLLWCQEELGHRTETRRSQRPQESQCGENARDAPSRKAGAKVHQGRSGRVCGGIKSPRLALARATQQERPPGPPRGPSRRQQR